MEETNDAGLTKSVVRNNQTKAGKKEYGNLSVEVVTDLSGMCSLEKEWNQLVVNSRATVFQLFEWQYLWWKHFAGKPHHHLYILLFRSGNKLVGIAPFFIQSHLLLHYRLYSKMLLLGSGLNESKTSALYLEKSGPADSLDVIVAYGFEETVGKQLAKFLEDKSYLWDEISLQNINEKSVVLQFIISKLKDRNYHFKKTLTDYCFQIPLPNNREAFLSFLKSSVQTPSKKNSNANEADTEYTLDSVGPGGNLDGTMQALSQMHDLKWHSAGKPGLFCDERFVSFQKEVVNAWADKGLLRLKRLRCEGKNIAIQLGFMFNNRFSLYLSGNKEPSTGLPSVDSGIDWIILMSMIEDAINAGCNIFDFGRGDENYKLQLTNQMSRNWQITITRNKQTGKSGKRHLLTRPIVYQLHLLHSWVSLRMYYEHDIYKVLSEEHRTPISIFFYIRHAATRLIKKLSNKYFQTGRYKNKSLPRHDDIIPRSNKKIQQSDYQTAESTADTSCDINISSRTGCITNYREMSKIEKAWEVLEDQFGDPLRSAAWFKACAQTFCPKDDLNLFTVRTNSEVTAIAPLSIREKPIRHLQFIGSSILEEPNSLVYKDLPSLRLLIQTILNQNLPVMLKGFDISSPEVHVLENELISQSCISLIKEESLPLVAINSDWDEFKNQISSSRLSSIRRLRRQAKKKGEIQFEVVFPTNENVDTYLDEVFRVEAESWKGRAGTALKTHQQLGRFFRLYAREAVKRKHLALFLLKINGKNIAVQFDIIHANRLWILKIGHDEAWSFCSPGIILMHEVVKYCFQNGLNGCEFLGSDEPWLHIWANDYHCISTYKIYPGNFKGKLSLITDHAQRYTSSAVSKMKNRKIR